MIERSVLYWAGPRKMPIRLLPKAVAIAGQEANPQLPGGSGSPMIGYGAMQFWLIQLLSRWVVEPLVAIGHPGTISAKSLTMP